ncbi:MAG TPA: GNAT family N-acetyltransferase [Ktedonobacterales bacterium]|jgi:GNAT superfamily N-acetyltransferase
MMLDEKQQLAAVEANWCAAWKSLSSVRKAPRSVVEDTAEWVRVYTPNGPDMLLNIILRFRAHAPLQQSDLERAIAPYRQHGLPFQWWQTLESSPPGLSQALRRLGMYPWGNATAMTLPLDGWQPPARVLQNPRVTIRNVPMKDQAGRASALEVICTVFSVPPEYMSRWCTINPCFRIYLAELEGRPVAAMALLQDGDVAGLYHVATRSRYRRQGIAARMIVQGLQEAMAEGATLGVLTATPDGQPLYEQLGYRTCGVIEQWMPANALLSQLYYGMGRQGMEHLL